MVGSETTDAVATITLDRPDRLNAIVPELMEAFERAFGYDATYMKDVLAASRAAFLHIADIWEHRQDGAEPRPIERLLHVSRHRKPDPSVREARERVRTALRTDGIQVPKGAETVNHAPAGILADLVP